MLILKYIKDRSNVDMILHFYSCFCHDTLREMEFDEPGSAWFDPSNDICESFIRYANTYTVNPNLTELANAKKILIEHALDNKGIFNQNVFHRYGITEGVETKPLYMPMVLEHMRRYSDYGYHITSKFLAEYKLYREIIDGPSGVIRLHGIYIEIQKQTDGSENALELSMTIL